MYDISIVLIPEGCSFLTQLANIIQYLSARYIVSNEKDLVMNV
jgi:hypothetical protein